MSAVDAGFLPAGPTRLVARLLPAFVRDGSLALDATAGNGHDTLTLARLVGARGRVWALDLQPQAIDATRRRLEEAGLLARAELAVGDHARLAERLPAALHGRLAAIVFNLGYLPGADHTTITRADSTLAALDQAALRLAPGGLLAVTAYPGHAGGDEEAEAVQGWVAARPRGIWRAWSVSLGNVAASAPRTHLLERLGLDPA